jgi:hypothetical protein
MERSGLRSFTFTQQTSTEIRNLVAWPLAIGY